MMSYQESDWLTLNASVENKSKEKITLDVAIRLLETSREFIPVRTGRNGGCLTGKPITSNGRVK